MRWYVTLSYLCLEVCNPKQLPAALLKYAKGTKSRFIKELTALRKGRWKERGREREKKPATPGAAFSGPPCLRGILCFSQGLFVSLVLYREQGRPVWIHYLPVSTPVVEFTLGSKWQPWAWVRGRGRGHSHQLTFSALTFHHSGCFNTLFK